MVSFSYSAIPLFEERFMTLYRRQAMHARAAGRIGFFEQLKCIAIQSLNVFPDAVAASIATLCVVLAVWMTA